MSGVTVTFIGSGDAFGSGGRLQTCILVDGPGLRFVIDCGATSLVGLRQRGIDPNSIDVILLTHLHGDHCSGVPFLLLDAMLGSRRESPLVLAGPEGTEAHLGQLQEALFPGSAIMTPRFPIDHLEISPGGPTHVAGLIVRAVEARHAPAARPLALRIDIGGTSIAYTGDGERTDALVKLVAGVDLLIAESYFYDKQVPGHLSYPDIASFDVKQIVLTHMHDNMLAHADAVPEPCAYDGCTISL